MSVVLLLLAQVRTPTVGDTVWVTRRVTLPARHTVRAANWELTGDVELLGRARVVVRDGSADVSYPLVAWTAGSHTVSVPGPVLLAPDGTVDSVAAESMTITVASVLPRGVPDTALAPQPQAGLVHRETVTWMPLGLLLGGASLLLLPLHWWWRRRGPRAPALAGSPPAAPPLAEWAEAGESRIVLAAAAARLRVAIEAAADAAPEAAADEAVELLRDLDRARFSSAMPAHVVELHARANALADRIAPAAVEP